MLRRGQALPCAANSDSTGSRLIALGLTFNLGLILDKVLIYRQHLEDALVNFGLLNFRLVVGVALAAGGAQKAA